MLARCNASTPIRPTSPNTWRTHWPAGRALAGAARALGEALSVAFQASLTSEEARPTRFRLLLTPVDQLPENGAPNQGVLRLRFDESRPFTADELRRLAPSSPFETALIGAQAEEEKLRDLGPRALRAGVARADLGRAQLGPELDLRSDHSRQRPGAARGALRRQAGGRARARRPGRRADGRVRLGVASRDVCSRARGSSRRARCAASPCAFSDAGRALARGADRSAMLRRSIQLVRGARHGGMILVVDGDEVSVLNNFDGLRLKYRLQQDEPSHRYRTLLLRDPGARRRDHDETDGGVGRLCAGFEPGSERDSSTLSSSSVVSSPISPPSTARWSSTSDSACSALVPRSRPSFRRPRESGVHSIPKVTSASPT